MADSPAHSDYDEVMCLPCVTEILHEWDNMVCLPCAAASPHERKSVSFGQTETFPCPKDPNAWKIPDRSHDTKSYSHSIRIKSMCKRREGRWAYIKAMLLHKQVLSDNDDLPDLDAPELGTPSTCPDKLCSQSPREHCEKMAYRHRMSHRAYLIG